VHVVFFVSGFMFGVVDRILGFSVLLYLLYLVSSATKEIFNDSKRICIVFVFVFVGMFSFGHFDLKGASFVRLEIW
jgi:hypothetical protein